jgi:hypothetical protein
MYSILFWHKFLSKLFFAKALKNTKSFFINFLNFDGNLASRKQFNPLKITAQITNWAPFPKRKCRKCHHLENSSVSQIKEEVPLKQDFHNFEWIFFPDGPPKLFVLSLNETQKKWNCIARRDA